MENINKKDFSRIYELMSFDRGKTLYEMEQRWDNILSEAQVPAGSYVRKEIENSAKSENINKTWAEIKQDFGSNGTETDNIKLYNAWVDGKWRPGVAVPSQYQTTTYKSKSNQVTTTTTSTPNANNSVKLKYDANALLAYAVEKREQALKPGGDINSIDKYGALALYFQDVRDNKAQDVTKYRLSQSGVDSFIAEFEKMIAGDNTKLQQYIDKGKGITVQMVGNEFQVKTNSTGKTTTLSGDKNNDGVVDSKDLAPDQKMDNSGKSNDTEDLDYDADAEGFEEEEPEMDREIDTTRKMEIKPSNNGWEDFFAKQFGK